MENPKLSLILKGGGVKGIAIAGAVQELEKHLEFSTYVGTSAGAIVGSLLASGFSGKEIVELLKVTDFRLFMPEGKLKKTFNFFFNKGMHSAEPLIQWLSNNIHTKISNSVGLKMRDLPKRLIIFATGTRTGTVVFDSKGSNRDTSVPFAVRCSASLPPQFIPAEHDGQFVYDGGMLHNFPVQEFKKLVPERPFVAIYLGRDTAPSYKRRSFLNDIGQIFLNRDEKNCCRRTH